MDKDSQPPEPSTMNSNATTSGQSLRHLNKSSYKISKAAPSFRKPFDPSPAPLPPPPVSNPPAETPNPNQPPVYNISRADFRDIVQKLTGSPAHDRASTPPPPMTVQSAPKPPSSRLHRILPPPLLFRPSPPLSPLPPLLLQVLIPIDKLLQPQTSNPPPVPSPISSRRANTTLFPPPTPDAKKLPASQPLISPEPPRFQAPRSRFRRRGPEEERRERNWKWLVRWCRRSWTRTRRGRLWRGRRGPRRRRSWRGNRRKRSRRSYRP